MHNPFEVIEARLRNIETLLLDLKHQPKAVHSSTQFIEKPLSISEASKFLNLSVSTLYSKVSRGELPVMKRGKRLYFSLPELIDYLKEGRKKSKKEIEAEAYQYLVKSKKG